MVETVRLEGWSKKKRLKAKNTTHTKTNRNQAKKRRKTRKTRKNSGECEVSRMKKRKG